MSEENAPNIFLLLGIDPDQPWNQAEFDRLIEEKRREWSAATNIPTQKGIRAKQNLGLIPAMKKAATDPVARQSQTMAARQQLTEDKKQQLAQLELALELIESKGWLQQNELDQLIKDFKGSFSESEIKKKIRVEIRQEKNVSKQRKPALESSKAGLITKKLESLKKVDLYDFLGMNSNTATTLLRQKASDAYKEITQKAIKSADDTTTSELCGQCLTIFNSDNERAKYDETLRLAVFDDVKKNLDRVGQGTKRIEASQIEEILRRARQGGLTPDETMDVIREYASSKSYSWTMPLGTEEKVRNLQRCGNCKNLNESDHKFCTQCNQPLYGSCPKCEKAVSSDSRACGDCGFPVGNRAYVDFLISEVSKAIQQHDLSVAVDLVEQIRNSWPARAKDQLLVDLAALDKRVKAEQTEQQSTLRQMENLVQTRHFFKARTLLPQLEKVLPASSPQTQDFRKKITTAIQESDSRLAKARQMTGSNSDQVIAIYQEALRICQDCQEARDMLSKTPPNPPVNLLVKVSGVLVHLTWQASSSSGVNYTVVRKERGRPVSVSDGRELGTVSGTLFDDKSGESGISYFYAVYSNREGVFSKQAINLSEPVMLGQEVDKLTAEVQDRQVLLTWKAPPNVKEVIVVRSETRYPATISEGQRVVNLDSNRAVDSALQNGRKYYYTVFCQFQDTDSKLLITSGKRIEAIPQSPPEPIRKLDIVSHGDSTSRKLVFRWSAPGKGNVVLLRANRSTGLQVGDVIRSDDLSAHGDILSTKGNQATDEVVQLGVYYYTPVIVFQNMAYIGQEHKHVSIEDVSDLKVQNLGYALRLSWKWPASCMEVIVAYSNQDWPDLTKSDVTTISLTRAQYELHGYYDVLNPVVHDYYFTVLAVVGQGEQKINSSGLSSGARTRINLGRSRIILDYKVKKSLVGKKISLDLKIQGHGKLPALIMVHKQLSLPMKKQDGQVLLRFGDNEITGPHLTMSLPSISTRGQVYVKLFLEDETLYDIVTIHHPSPEKLKLSL